MIEDCIFCKIVAGEIPSSKVYEDDDILAFMDIQPVVKGHALVIPKRHFPSITDIPDDALKLVIAGVKRIASAQRSALNADGINVTQANGAIAGQVVPHLHFHVIPRFENDPHSWTAPQGSYDRPDEMQELARTIAEHAAKAQ
jgi:histidine triad (HIT) family protein